MLPDPLDQDAIANALYFARTQQNLTRGQLAHMAGCATSDVRHIEERTGIVPTAAAILDAVGLASSGTSDAGAEAETHDLQRGL